MTLSEFRNDLGSIINQTDTSGDFASTIITTTEANRNINEAALRVYREYALRYPEGLTTTAEGDVTEDQAVYPFGGDADDLMAIVAVFVLIDATDDEPTRAYPLDESEFYLTGSETISESAPRYIRRNILVDNVYTGAIEFPEECVPDHTTTGNEGLKIIYLKRPTDLSGDSDTLERLPEQYHYLISFGASIKCFMKMGEDERAFSTRALFEQEITNMKHTESQDDADQSFRLKIPRKDTLRFIHRRW